MSANTTATAGAVRAAERVCDRLRVGSFDTHEREHIAAIIDRETGCGELLAARETIAQWMIAKGYATGHGDTVEELLSELDWQLKEKQTALDLLLAALEALMRELDYIEGVPITVAQQARAAIARARGTAL